MFNYLNDGAGYQSKAVLAFLESNSGIECSWNKEKIDYDAKPRLARWENCREQGYIISMRVGLKQINIAFFEHRNSDEICAVKWEQSSINSLTIKTAEFGNIYKDKYDVSHSVSHGECYEMANWIYKELSNFYKETKAINTTKEK